MINTVIFDIGNVLTLFRWKEFYREKGYSEDELNRLEKATVKSVEWNEYDRGVLTEKEIIDSFVRNDPGIEGIIREALSDFTNLVVPCDYAIPWVKDLKKKGYRVLYLSNFSKKAEKECAKALEFIQYMDGGILSYRDKVIKPDAEIYRLIMKRYGLAAEECVFLDDTEKNVIGAREQGMHAILFTSYEQAREELQRLGVE